MSFRLLRSPLLVALLGLTPVVGCDLLNLLAPPEEEEPVRRRRGGDEGEGEGEGEEGEGEGEGLPPDTPPHPEGPRVQTFTASQSTLDDGDSATLTVVVSDPDGADDIVGALLVEPISGATLSTLSAEGAPGTFSTSVSWDTWRAAAPIEFVRGTVQRFARVQFSDAAGHRVTSTLAFTMTCNGQPACNNNCGEVRCAADGNQCLSTEGSPISDAQLCSFCDTGCQACTTGCACFDPAPDCTGGNDCLVTVGNEGNVTATTCTANTGPTLRNDGFIVWTVAGRAVPAGLNIRFGMPETLPTSTLFNKLCEPFGGLSDDVQVALPSDLIGGQAVVTVEDTCSVNALGQCEPVLGLASSVNGQGNRLTCVNPIGEPVDPNAGKFGQVCRGNGTCDGDMDCDTGSNTCVEFCSFDTDCGSCNFDNGGSGCTCNTSTGQCQTGGGGDFACAGTRSLSGTSVTSQAGTTSGGVQPTVPFCGGSGLSESWRFTPSQSGTYVIRSGGHDTVLAVHADCDATTSLACNDDGATDGVNNSQVSVSLTANVPVLITVRTFPGTGGANYTLSIARQ